MRLVRSRLAGIAVVASGLGLAPAVSPADGGPLVRDSFPAVSSDGRRIAFVSDRDSIDAIWIVDVDGRNEHRLTPPGFAGEAPAWSPDGRTVRFSGTGADSGVVFAVPAEGGTPRPLVRVPGRAPRLSPDGRRVAWLDGAWTRTALFVGTAANGAVENAMRVAGGTTTAWNPAWSPDGRFLAYTYGDSTHGLGIHVVRADGTDDHEVITLPRDAGSAQVPAWSRDGKRLAFQVSQRAPHVAHVWRSDAAGAHATRLAPHDALYLDEVPAWFPDGRHLAFQSDRTGTMRIWVMRANGTDARQASGRAP